MSATMLKPILSARQLGHSVTMDAIATSSSQIDEVLRSSNRDSQKAVVLFDRFHALTSADQDGFAAALIHRLLVERARNRGKNFSLPQERDLVHRPLPIPAPID